MIRIWRYFRAWINKNDGSIYQADNQILTTYEVIGYLLIIAALIIYLLHEKIGFQNTWSGWLLLFIGFSLAILGVAKRIEKKKNI